MRLARDGQFERQLMVESSLTLTPPPQPPDQTPPAEKAVSLAAQLKHVSDAKVIYSAAKRKCANVKHVNTMIGLIRIQTSIFFSSQLHINC